jgi:hypothetical protein
MFRKEIIPVTQSLHKQLGHVPIYSFLFLPLVFNQGLRLPASDAILPGYDEDVNIGCDLSSRAACYGFGFLECKHLGRAPENCDDGPDGNGLLNFVLLLEYEKDYLYAWLKEVSFELGVYYTQQIKFCKECGDRFRQVSL